MKYFLIIFLVISFFIFTKKKDVAAPPTNLEDVTQSNSQKYDSTKIPRDIFLERLYLGLDTMCRNPVVLDKVKTTQEYCLQRRTNYGQTCKTTAASALPEFINIKDKQARMQYTFEYFKCVMDD